MLYTPDISRCEIWQKPITARTSLVSPPTGHRAVHLTYFAQTLQENNKNISDIIVIRSDRFNGYAIGFGVVCPVAQVVVCKNHGEDDVDTKLSDLGILGKSSDDFKVTFLEMSSIRS